MRQGLYTLVIATMVWGVGGCSPAAGGGGGGGSVDRLSCGPGTHEVNGVCVADGAGDSTDAETDEADAGRIKSPGDTGEVTAPCKVFVGSYVIKDAIDLDVLQSYCEITGTLKIQTGFNIFELELPELAKIGHNLDVVTNNDLESLSLPKLTTVGARLVVGQPQSGNMALLSIEFPLLTTVGGYLRVTDNDKLTSLSLPQLDSVKEFLAISNPSLTSLDLPKLTVVGDDLAVVGNYDLTSFEFPQLTSVGGLEVHTTFALTSFAVPVLTSVGNLGITSNTSLASFDLSSLSEVNGNVSVWKNKGLAQCLIDDLITQIEASGNFTGAPQFCEAACPDSSPTTNNNDCTCEEVDSKTVATCP